VDEMFIEQVPVGGDRNFGYLVADEEEKKAIVVDPSFSPEWLVNPACARTARTVAYVPGEGCTMGRGGSEDEFARWHQGNREEGNCCSAIRFS